MQVKRLNYIDVAKGIGIVSMLVGHHLSGVDGLIKWIYSFHMPLFFFITGYLYESKKKSVMDIKTIVRNQAKNLLYPYVTFSALMLLWKFFFHNICGVPLYESEGPVEVFFWHAVTSYGVHALWFLPAMFWASVLFRIQSKRDRGGLVWLILSVFGAVFMAEMVHVPEIRHSIWYYLMNYTSRCILGLSFIWFGAMYTKLERSGGYVILAALGISLISGMMNDRASMYGSELGNPVLYYVSGVAGSIFILELSKRIRYCDCFFAFLGRNSLIIMATDLSFPDEIAWMVLGVTKITRLVPGTVVCIIMITVQIVIDVILIYGIHKYAGWMLRIPKRK